MLNTLPEIAIMVHPRLVPVARDDLEAASSGRPRLNVFMPGEAVPIDLLKLFLQEGATNERQHIAEVQGLKNVCENSVLEGYGFSRAVNDVGRLIPFTTSEVSNPLVPRRFWTTESALLVNSVIKLNPNHNGDEISSPFCITGP